MDSAAAPWSEAGNPVARRQQGEADGGRPAEQTQGAAEGAGPHARPGTASGLCTGLSVLCPTAAETAASAEAPGRRDPAEETPATRRTPASETEPTSKGQHRTFPQVQA